EAARGVPALVARLGRQQTMAACNFMSPVRPGATLTIELQPEPGAARGVRFEVRCGSQIAVSGRWTPGTDAAA
ncbi:MAG: CoA ligase, partial [Variovorax sp.]|nr:CoA ligase [Variovorax sp.]